MVFITSDKCYLNLDKKDYKENDVLGGLIIIHHLKQVLN